MENHIRRSALSKVDQIGVVIKDMEKAIVYYQSLGIGPFKPVSTTVVERKMGGKVVTDLTLDIRVAQMGPVQLELIQPLKGESIQKKFLERKGEGINHLGFFVEDIDIETAKLEMQGFKVVYSGRYQNGGGFAYFDTDKFGGVMFELLEWPSH